MIDIAETGSGKTHRDENFPVASFLIGPRFRAPILAFYNFVRAADDIADHETLQPGEKLALLDRLEAALLGQGPDEPVAARLRESLRQHHLDSRHPRDLLTAFRRDVTQSRYADFDDLVDYCRYSAMPVGRFVLDVHGENSAATWPANDALCAALQIINHLQDCKKDLAERDRVYLPQDMLSAHGATVDMLREPSSSPQLLGALRAVVTRTSALLDQSRPFADCIDNVRLAMEVGSIQKLAEALIAKLRTADPLTDRVHASKAEFALSAALGAASALLTHAFYAGRRRPVADGVQ